MDSEYFNKLSLIYDKKIKTKPHFFLDNVVSGPFGSTLKSHSYLQEGIAFVRVENLKDRFHLRKDSLVYISEGDNKLLKNSQLFLNDLVMSKVGNTIGLIARVDEELETCNISENNLGIKLKTFNEVEKFFILTYLNCDFAQNLILRRISGNAQPKLNVGDLYKIPIPILSFSIQEIIRKFVITSYSKIKESKIIYKEAEEILLKELDLLDFTPSNRNISIKSFKESFGKTGRLDSEYYQPKYEELESKIRNYKNGFSLVEDICIIKNKNFLLKEDLDYNYIELSDIGNNGMISSFSRLQGKDLPSRARRIISENDLIISSIEGSLSSCAIIEKDLHNSICSTGFYVASSQEINSETLLLLFKTVVIDLMKRGCSGTILTAISIDAFSKIPLPKIDAKVQELIAMKIQESQLLISQSKQILEEAKLMVERAIETGAF